MASLDDALTRQADRFFIETAMTLPLLSREQEQDLACRWRDHRDEAAMQELVAAHTRQVVALASRFRHYGLPLNDLVQEGTLGLMQAVNRFQPDRAVRFSTYAGWWIRAAMQEFILRNWSIVRLGSTAAQKSLFFNLRRLRARVLAEKPGHTALDTDGLRRIAEELSVPVDDVAQMEQRLTAGDQSLNSTLSPDGDDEWQDFLPDNGPTPEETVMASHDRDRMRHWLAQAMDALSPRERTIIAARCLREDGMTLGDLGRDLGISKERVRQLESRALGKLRATLRHLAGDAAPAV